MSQRASQIIRQLRDYESRNVTFIDPEGGWPIVWESARGMTVRDTEGREYLDLTAAFGVAAAGHANRAVVRAAQEQIERLLHGMGDVHPHEPKARLVRELSRLTFERWTSREDSEASVTGKTIFCNSGFEAVEAALKTAMLATGRRGVIAFEGAYHGLGYGALNATHRSHFRGPFQSQLGEFGHFVPFPESVEDLDRTESAIRRWCHQKSVGAILVEPVQGRGGIRVPPAEFLTLLRELSDEYGVLLIVDEIFTGFGRTGKWFACEHSGVVPDLICLGKALTGGFPLSACVGRAELMDRAWPPSSGEAIHTSTFLGHPVGCAMALAQIDEIRSLRLPQHAAQLGRQLIKLLDTVMPPIGNYHFEVRGLGLMAGIEIRRGNDAPAVEECLAATKRMLEDGFIVLPEGEHGNIIAFTPPLIVNELEICRATEALMHALLKVLAP